MELILFDLVAGLFIRVLVWLVVATVKFAARCAWTLVVDHPGLSLVLCAAAVNEGWWTSQWSPLVMFALGVLAVARFLSVHPPKDIARTVKREARRTQKVAVPVAAAREWVRARRLEGKPPPPSGVYPSTPEPQAIPVGPVEVAP